MAVVKVAGKQYLVKEGDQIKVNHLDLNVGEKITVKDELSDKNLNLEVIEQTRSKKILVIKFRNKTRYLRKKGHRNELTVLKVKKAEIKEKKSESKASKKSEK